MKIKLCRLCLSAIAAVPVSVFAFADGGPNASKTVDGKSLALEEFQGSDTLMNRAWQFRFGDDASWASVDCDDAKWRWLDLPHDFQFELPWDKGARPAHGYKPLKVAWYRRHFKADPIWKGKLVFAEFEGIMAVGDVFLNGEKIASTEYGYLGCWADLTSKLNWEGDNVLAVRADCGHKGGSRWYTGGGIVRDVHLVVKSQVSVSRNGFYIKSGVKDGAAFADALVQLDGYMGQGGKNKLEIILEVFDPDGKRVARESAVAPWSKKAHQEVELPRAAIADPKLWDIDSPNLYTATATLKLNGTVVDRVKDRFGIRTIEFDKDFGFKLNGRKVFLAGMANHADLGALGAAVFDRGIERLFRTMKAFGFNAVRCSHNPYSKSFLRLADEMGLLVVDELIDKWTTGTHYWNGRKPFMEIWPQLITEWVKRDRNHPSVIVWSIGNETQMREDICGFDTDDWSVTSYRIFDTMVKRWDATRPTTAAMFPAREGSVTMKDKGFNEDPKPPELSRITEIASFNYCYEDYPSYKRHAPELNIFQSEASVHALQRPYVAMDREHSIGLCWWGAIEYWGESDGWPKKGWSYSFFNRTLDPFPTAYLIKSFLASEPMAEIAVVEPAKGDEAVVWNDIKVGRMNAVSDWTFPEGSVLPVVYVYTNAEEAELFVNGKSLGVKKNNETDPKTAHALRWTDVKYEPGRIEAVARTGGKEVARRVIETAGKAVRLEAVVENAEDWKGDGQDLLYVHVTAVDEAERRVRAAADSVKFEVSGAATLLAVDDGDERTDFLFRNVDEKPLRDGSLLVILRSKGQPGEVTLKATSAAFAPLSLALKTQR